MHLESCVERNDKPRATSADSNNHLLQGTQRRSGEVERQHDHTADREHSSERRRHR